MDKNLEKDLSVKKVLKAEDLLKKKDLLKKRFNQSAFFDTELGRFKFRVPTREDIMDSEGFALDGENMEDEMLIYACCLEPSLKSEEIQGLKDDANDHPVTVVRKIFLIGEIATLSRDLIKLAGFGEESVKVYKEVKN